MADNVQMSRKECYNWLQALKVQGTPESEDICVKPQDALPLPILEARLRDLPRPRAPLCTDEEIEALREA